MDGYAARSTDIPDVADGPAGDRHQRGRARLPGAGRSRRGRAYLHRRSSAPGADCIVIQEDTEASEDASS